MKLSLVVSAGANQGKVITVPGTQFIIGRDEGCHLRPASPAISKRHCAVFVRSGEVFVRDLGSTNGTRLNGVRLGRIAQRLRQGDHLQPGKVLLTVKTLEEESGSEAAVLDDPALRGESAAPPLGLATAECPIVGADSPAAGDGQPHRAVEGAEMRVDMVPFRTKHHQFAGLIGGDRQ